MTRLLKGAQTCRWGADRLYDDDEHGTCMASLIAGRQYGAAKRARLIPVQAWQVSCEATFSGYLWLFSEIINDFQADKASGAADYAIINFSASKSMRRRLFNA
jgi:hypothetical protein